jgi:CubicO group peptidase (beta-lactamase class C family)
MRLSHKIVTIVWLLALAAAGARSQGLDRAAVAARAGAWLKTYAEAGDFSGVALLAQGDHIVFQEAFGMADAQVHSPNRSDTRFRIASLSKTFTAAAIETLVSEGKLRYSDPLSAYVSGMPNGETITIEQLLLHESGVGVLDDPDAYTECLSRADLLRRLAAAKPLFVPGKGSQYSNEGYFLLASVIERASGAAYAEFLRQRFFGPLHMENSGTACRDLPSGHSAFGSVATEAEERSRPLPFNEAAMDGPGSIYSSAADLLSWLRAVDTDPGFGFGKLKYPYGWGKRKYSTRDLIEQTGEVAGFVSHIAIYPKEHIYAIVLSNVQSGFITRIPRDLEAVLFGGTVSKPPVAAAVTLGERSMRQYTGVYHSKEIRYPQTLEIRDGRLAMHWGNDPFWREMAMTGGDTFFERAEYAEIRFERGADGLVHRMIWIWPGGARLSFDKDQIEPSPQPIVPDSQ